MCGGQLAYTPTRDKIKIDSSELKSPAIHTSNWAWRFIHNPHIFAVCPSYFLLGENILHYSLIVNDGVHAKCMMLMLHDPIPFKSFAVILCHQYKIRNLLENYLQICSSVWSLCNTNLGYSSLFFYIVADQSYIYSKLILPTSTDD